MLKKQRKYLIHITVIILDKNITKYEKERGREIITELLSII